MVSGHGACKCDMVQAGNTGQARCEETRLGLTLFPACGGVSRGMRVSCKTQR